MTATAPESNIDRRPYKIHVLTKPQTYRIRTYNIPTYYVCLHSFENSPFFRLQAFPNSLAIEVCSFDLTDLFNFLPISIVAYGFESPGTVPFLAVTSSSEILLLISAPKDLALTDPEDDMKW